MNKKAIVILGTSIGGIAALKPGDTVRLTVGFVRGSQVEREDDINVELRTVIRIHGGVPQFVCGWRDHVWRVCCDTEFRTGFMSLLQ